MPAGTKNPHKSAKAVTTKLEQEEDPDHGDRSEDAQPRTQTYGNFTKTEIRKRSRVFFQRQHRVIVRNLSYKITDAKLRAEFERFGTLEDVNILKRPDGRLVGCAFLQYSKKEESDRAIREMDSEVYLGRKIEVSYAQDKAAYQRVKTEKEPKKEKIEADTEAPEDDDDMEIKEESSDEEEEGGSGNESDDDDSGDSNEEDEVPEEEDNKAAIGELSVKRERNHSDIEEGRTVFVKNVPYEVEAEELNEVMSQFGRVEKVLINKERVSGHSKGTAFVIFKLKDSAQMCHRQSFKIQVHDQFLEILEALRKKDIMDREKSKLERRSKDTRNLYLLKEGVIMAGSPAARDVSKTDMAQRLRLEQRNNEMLKNYNRFVSKERLTVHNIPQTTTNDELRKIILQQTSHKPLECRVMRDSRPSFGNPVGRSRGYGFVSFKQHEAALEVLRKLNNNPSVFGKNHRPIVSFSIEDLKVHNIKQKRLEKSRLNNPTYQKKMEELKKKKQQNKLSKKEAKRLELEQLSVAPSAVLRKLTSRDNEPSKAEMQKPKTKDRKRDIEHTITPFTGEISKKGKGGIRSNRKIQHQADAHVQRLKQERKETKKKQLHLEHARNRLQKAARRVKPKVNYQDLKKEDSYFKETVGKYKDMITHATQQPVRSKWYNE